MLVPVTHSGHTDTLSPFEPSGAPKCVTKETDKEVGQNMYVQAGDAVIRINKTVAEAVSPENSPSVRVA